MMEFRFVCAIVLWISLFQWNISHAEEDSRSKRASSSLLSYSTFNSTQIKYIVDQHNAKRRAVQPEAANMRLITWNEELASMASDHSRLCTFEHANKAGIGENVYTTGTQDVDAVVKIFVDDWYDERGDYDYENNECKSGEICGHYTQLVWAESHEVGCAISLCSDIDGIGQQGRILICNYRAAGNAVITIDGVENPLPPYIKGTVPCSECEEGLDCIIGLCGKQEVLAKAATTAAGPRVVIDHVTPTSAGEADLCYQQNKKMIDTWNEQMRQWRYDDMARWRRNMDRYEKYLEDASP